MNRPLPSVLIAVSVATLLGLTSLCAHAQRAPFGFQWGERLAALPQATEILQVENITVLRYEHESLPTNFRDIQEVILKVCDAEGLQQVHAVSGLLSGEDARNKFASAYKEGLRRYGAVSEGNPDNGTASWSKARVTMFARLAEPGFYRIVMVYDGPEFQSCAKTYDQQNGPK